MGRDRARDRLRRRMPGLAAVLRLVDPPGRVPHADRVHAPAARVPRRQPDPGAGDRRRLVAAAAPRRRPPGRDHGRDPVAVVRRAGGDRRLDHRHPRGPGGRDDPLRRRVPRARIGRGHRRAHAVARWNGAGFVSPADRLDRGGHLRVVARRHLRPGRGSGARLPGVAVDGRQHRAGSLAARRRRHVRPSTARDRRRGPVRVVHGPGADDAAALPGARPALDGGPGAGRASGARRRRQRADRARDLGSSRARRPLGADLDGRRGAGDGRARGARGWAGRRDVARGRGGRVARHGERYRSRVSRPDEAAHHRPAADHHRSRDVPGGGRGSPGRPDPRDPARRHARGGRRQRDEHVPRSRYRRGHEADPAAPPAGPPHRARRRAAVRVTCWPRAPICSWP